LHDNSVIHISHQEIAYDLNTSREVISRLLKQLENMGAIKLGRNRIVLLD
ncbi:MAG: winged helix-turn-helix domain-containing protein, partial [Cyclobacteriaceae bacterium]|nr:winged helix-turn-helix domain-containing protein [Cyclobacteriaceae bacterium]